MQRSISSFFGAGAARKAEEKQPAKRRRKKARVADESSDEEAAAEHEVKEPVDAVKGAGRKRARKAEGSGDAAAKGAAEDKEEKEEASAKASGAAMNDGVDDAALGAEEEEVKEGDAGAADDGNGEEEDEEDEEDEEEEGEEEGVEKEKEEKEAKKAARALANAPSGFHPVEDAEWKQGKPVPYAALAHAFAKVEATTKRLEIQRIVCDLLRSTIALTPEDLLRLVYLASNKLAPQFENLELGIGDALLMKAIVEATGRTLRSVKDLYTEHGDLGTVAALSRATQRTLFPPPPLTVRGVYKAFRDIASMSGNKSQDRKVQAIKKLIVSCKEEEARYVIRGLQGKLRIGLAESSVIVALAHAVTITPPGPLPLEVLDTRRKLGGQGSAQALEQAVLELKRVYSELPSLDVIVPKMLEHGLKGLHEHCHLEVGVPVKPMLAKPTHGVSEVLDRFTGIDFTCEYKYDGERAQIHLMPDGSVKIFSRNLEDNTPKYPDVARAMPACAAKGLETCVLDAEVVAYDRDTKRLLPFQVLSTRSRKEVDADSVKVQVIIMAFDIIYRNGESLLRRPLAERRKILHESLTPTEGILQFAVCRESADTEELAAFLDDSVKDGCEGLMVKTMTQDATYEPSKRSLNWLKLKKDYLEGVGDSLDLVVIGAYEGRGKRTGVYGAFLLACYDEDSEEFQSICKIGTGFSEENLAQHHALFKDKVLPKAPSSYVTGPTLEPDVWLDACQVWEVRAADLSISPAHKAAMGKADPVKGIALRFPRFVRVREDKQPEECTSADQVYEMYQSQALVGN